MGEYNSIVGAGQIHIDDRAPPSQGRSSCGAPGQAYLRINRRHETIPGEHPASILVKRSAATLNSTISVRSGADWDEVVVQRRCGGRGIIFSDGVNAEAQSIRIYVTAGQLVKRPKLRGRRHSNLNRANKLA